MKQGKLFGKKAVEINLEMNGGVADKSIEIRHNTFNSLNKGLKSSGITKKGNNY